MTRDELANFRLGDDATPVAYRLRFEPDLGSSRFAGDAEIDVELARELEEVVLNAADLDLDTVEAVLPDGAQVRATVALDPELDRATLRFEAPLPKGGVTLHLAFRGPLRDDLVGFYRSTFTDADGTDHVIATTQLAATDARRAFPCFDEPAMKATFEITLAVPAGLSGFSNMKEVARAPMPDGRTEVRFAPTIKMSSYLVAFAVGPFEATHTVDVDGVPLSVVVPKGKRHLAEFALEVGTHSLRFYRDYFGLPYPGDKVDLLAIPDFAFGAMENLGCITFRETALLVDPATASASELERVAEVVAHELAHMWFGDLVTMEWWEGIWLNEAFATFLSYHCMDDFRPQWHMWERFSEACEAGLTIDALHSTRPIEFPVLSPADATAMIDTITYEKGASVLRMLEQYLGAEVYRDGIRRYLRTHAYANTQTSDLWTALAEVSGKPVADVMDSWILQGGHPIVTSSGGTITQTPFQFGPADGASNIGSSWIIPVHSRPLSGGEAVVQLLGDEPVELATPHPAIVNAGGSGVYRTNYDTDELEAIAASFGSLTEIERAVLLADTRALALAGNRSVHDVLTLADGLGTRIEPSSWATVTQFLVLLDRIVDDELRPALQARTRRIVGPVIDELGWTVASGEDERSTHVRAAAVSCLGVVGADPAVREEAARRFDSGRLDGDVALSVIEVVASMRRDGDRDEMLARFRDAKDPQEEDRYRSGVALYADEVLAVETFERCFELFRGQDAPFVVRQLLDNRVAGRAVWEAMSEVWLPTVERVAPLMQFALGMGVASLVSDPAFAARVAAFHREHPIANGQRRIEQAVERMLIGVAFAERARPGLRAALS